MARTSDDRGFAADYARVVEAFLSGDDEESGGLESARRCLYSLGIQLASWRNDDGTEILVEADQLDTVFRLSLTTSRHVKALESALADHPGLKAVMMEKHVVVPWHRPLAMLRLGPLRIS